jgi:DNA-binding NarL/FixJ family response regulator
VLLADDHTVVRSGLRMVRDAQPDIEVVAEAGDGAEAVKLALNNEVDLAILDVAMPRMTGLQAVAELQRRRPELRVLIPRIRSPRASRKSSSSSPRGTPARRSPRPL